ncbi:serine/threonine-protein kinase [Actinomadura luteofluorescens]|uniref:serine/threonine-protein kinase n=1 Tax=Actinomadura luteofluorescens TaxID=46163 RepID=UPI0034907C80
MDRGTLIAGRYELVERLGRGGMGEVWAGRDRDLHRDVAVKFLLDGADTPPDLLHRFEREAVAAAQINHPNVVALHDRGVHDGLRFMVMERVEGATLAAHMRDGRPMEPARALDITQAICAALAAAHNAKVVHYDIKPSNVMLTSDGRVKVVDFGIAGFSHAHTYTVAPTAMLAPAGTASYGAPEQFLDQRGDERSDLYALGSVLFALLAGEPPFTGANDLSVIRRKTDGEAPRLNALCPDVPPYLADLVSDLLQRDPDRRPRSAQAVQERLQQARFPTVPDRSEERAGAGAQGTLSLSAQVPAQEVVRPEAGEAFEITWTGEEPAESYTKALKKAPGPRWIVVGTLVVIAPLVIWLGAVWGDDSTSDPAGFAAFIAMYPGFFCGVAAVLYGIYLASYTPAWLRHSRGLRHRCPWSLRVDSRGITTRDPRCATPSRGPAGRSAFLWNEIETVSLERTAAGRHHRCETLRVRFCETGPESSRFRPAGWIGLDLSIPDLEKGQGERRPVCILGPMSEQEYDALFAALVQHAGSRWRPRIGP